MKRNLSLFAFALGALAVFNPAQAAETFAADWESLKRREPAPEWFQDAKFGIYFHWGVYSVPAFGSEWYPRNMHIKKQSEYRHHLEKYGDPTKFGYADFVPQFKAEKFDAAEWADLFAKAGARFAGPVAEHHDGFAMWASKVTPWNAGDMGPKRDLTGELEKAVRQRGMRFITTFHHARNNLWQKNNNWTGHYQFVKTDFPSLLEDPQRAILYGYLPRADFLKMWKAKLVEVIDNYSPDIIWFDSWLDEIPDAEKTAFLAHYFNHAASKNKEVVVTYKQQDLPRDVGVEDFEKGRADHLTEYVWLTDDTISRGSWCYTQDLTIKPTDEVLHSMIDIVSKNGVLLLNLSPMADGTIPDLQKRVLLELGEWLKTNGEAIYDTRPWAVYGEGPTRMGKGGAFIRWRGQYTAEDIRYTRSKDNRSLYAIALGWPQAQMTLSAVQVNRAAPDARVTLLGHDQPLKFSVNEQKRLTIEVPALAEDARPGQFAFAFKLTGFEAEAHPLAALAGDESALQLVADKATLEGDKLGVESKDGRTNIGFWDNSSERIHWLLKVPQAGQYAVRGEFAMTAPACSLKLQVEGQELKFKVTTTGGWDKPKMVDAGRLAFAKPGVYHVVLSAADPAAWRAVNVWQLQFSLAGK